MIVICGLQKEREAYSIHTRFVRTINNPPPPLVQCSWGIGQEFKIKFKASSEVGGCLDEAVTFTIA